MAKIGLIFLTLWENVCHPSIRTLVRDRLLNKLIQDYDIFQEKNTKQFLRN